MKSALIIGATGATGRQLMALLLGSRHYQRIVIVHHRPTPWAREPKVEEHVLDFSALDELKVVGEVDELFCCIGTTIKRAGSKAALREVDFAYPLALAGWLKGHSPQARYHLISAQGASRASFSHYLRTKGDTEDALKALQLRALVIYHPSLLDGERDEPRLAEAMGNRVLALVSALPGLQRFQATAISALAQTLYTQSLSKREAQLCLSPIAIKHWDSPL